MNLLNLGGDQRLDLGDLTFALSQVPTGLTNELTGSFCVAPGEAAIVTGFRPAASGTTAVVVGESGVPNVAFLGQRIAATVTPGVFTMQGPATQTVSTATLPAATYTVFIRFNRIPGVSQTRKFWAKALPGSEYSQLTDTRQVATWEMRLETSAPSAEWVPIATAVVTAAGAGQGNTVTVTDTRLLYFEGRVDQGCVPVWGSAADRNADRTIGNTGSLRRQLDAIRACLVDIKGRGLAKWYQPNISGMLVGSAFTLADTPVVNTVTIGDNKFYLNCNNNTPGIAFDASNDYMIFNRGAGVLTRYRAGAQTMFLYGSGAANFGQFMLGGGFLTVNQPANASQYGIGTYTTDANTPASVGIQSISAKSAILEFGQNGYGSSYGYLRSTWAANQLTLGLAINNVLFLQGILGQGQNGIATEISGQSLAIKTSSVSVTPSSMSLGGRTLPNAMLLWSSGVYQPGSTNSDNTNVQGTVANSVGALPTAVYKTDGGGHNSILLTFGVNVPAQATVLLTGAYSVASGKVYQCGYQFISGNQIVVGIANGSDNPVNQSFTFYIFYGN